MKYRIIFTLVSLLSFFISKADISMPSIFSSNMVLQRNMDIPVWGWSSPGERIIISIGDQKIRVLGDKSGKWSVKIAPMTAGGPYEMVIDGKNEIRFTNILIGDVWICSGQSNMEWSVSRSNNAEEEIAAADYPEIRLFAVPNQINKAPLDNTDPAEWTICSPETTGPFSAVGYYFGRQLQQDLKIPIGLINTTWGGTDVESWISAESIRGDPDLSDKLTALHNLDVDEAAKKIQEEFEQWLQRLREMDNGYRDDVYLWAAADMDYSNWSEMELPGLWEDRGLEDLDGTVWFMKEINLPENVQQNGLDINLGPIDDSDIVWLNGNKIGETFNIYNRNRKYYADPQILLPGKNKIVVRVEDYRGGGGIYGDKSQMWIEASGYKESLVGKWKYQVGCDSLPSNPPINDFGPNSYPTLLFNAMINPLLPYGIKGVIWYQGENNAGRAYQYRRLFPQLITDWRTHWGQGDFPFLFVQLANFMQPKDPPEESAWAELREAQTMTLSLPATGMASTIDIGEANDIHPRNKQDVGLRLALSAYKVAYGMDIVHIGPTYESMKIDKDKVIITFKNTGTGLLVNDLYGYINGFTVAGEDHKFYWAKAEKIDDKSVIVYSDKVPAPVAVRYGWADNPHDLNLYNKEGLPANPFRTDNWEGITAGRK